MASSCPEKAKNIECNAQKVTACGNGLKKNGIVSVKDVAAFNICTENAGKGMLDVKVIGPGGEQEKVDVCKVDENNYSCAYYPKKEGLYVVTIFYGGQQITESPYEVDVLPYEDPKIKVYGPGLYGGVEGYPARFSAELNGETGTLGYLVKGPSHAKIQRFDKGDGLEDVKYLPTVPGEYAVHILCDNKDLPFSPYTARIQSKGNYFPEKPSKPLKHFTPESAQGVNLRPIIIDGSNVAHSHGTALKFSCKGIKIAIEYFEQKGLKVVAMTPRSRMQRRFGKIKIVDCQILRELEIQKRVILTPSRYIDGRLVEPYDDRLMFTLAKEIGAIIVSNDNFKDLMLENEDFKDIACNRILNFCWYQDILLIAQDPLGQHGPSLLEFLTLEEGSQPRSTEVEVEQISLEKLSGLSAEERKVTLSRHLLPIIDRWYPDVSREIVSNLLEMDDSDILNLLENQESLYAEVEEMLAVLQDKRAN